MEGGGGGGGGEGEGGRAMIGDLRQCVRRKRRSSEPSYDGREESLMESSDGSLTESCDEGIEMATGTK